MISLRDSAIEALLALVDAAYAWASPPSRRLRLWTEVPPSCRPCCFLFEGGRESYSWGNDGRPKRIIEAQLFVYIDARDPMALGASQLDRIMDALDAALAPAEPLSGRQTLGGLVHNCRIDGAPFKDPGDLDGDGLLIAPVKLILP